MAERTDTEEKLELAVQPEVSATPVTIDRELVQAQQKTADALATIAEALTPARLAEALTGLAKAQAVGQIAAAMIGAANTNGLDARNYGRIETETAILLGKVFDKAMQHLNSGGGSTKADVQVDVDAEDGFRAWLESNDPGDESDGK